MKPFHVPVLLKEVLSLFEGISLDCFFEGTVGAGGHATALLEAHPELSRYLACDRDPKALRIAQDVLEPWGKKVEWIHGPFAELDDYLNERGIEWIDGFLVDVGLSTMQLDDMERGFSFLKEAPLDMRMNPEGELTAEMIVNRYSEAQLAKILSEYGEEPKAKQVAKAIVFHRKKKKIRTTKELVSVVEPVAMKGRLHPATLTFQALRITVNDELHQLEKGVLAAIDRLAIGGVIGVISFHSLEDRIVKNLLRDRKDCLEILTKKPLIASDEELRKNPRSRSAKLRGARKVAVRS